MEQHEKTAKFRIRHIEPIKSRRIKVSNRRTTKPGLLNYHSSSTKCGITATTSQNPVRPSDFSFNSVLSNTRKNSVQQSLFCNIKEIQETSANDDDSLIIELHNILNEKPSTKETGVPRPKEPMRINLDLPTTKERDLSKPAKKLPKVMSHRVFY